MTTDEIEAIRTVLDKLVAVEGRPVVFRDEWAMHKYGLDAPIGIRSPLTSEEVAAARNALDNAS